MLALVLCNYLPKLICFSALVDISLTALIVSWFSLTKMFAYRYGFVSFSFCTAACYIRVFVLSQEQTFLPEVDSSM